MEALIASLPAGLVWWRENPKWSQGIPLPPLKKVEFAAPDPAPPAPAPVQVPVESAPVKENIQPEPTLTPIRIKTQPHVVDGILNLVDPMYEICGAETRSMLREHFIQKVREFVTTSEGAAQFGEKAVKSILASRTGYSEGWMTVLAFLLDAEIEFRTKKYSCPGDIRKFYLRL